MGGLVIADKERVQVRRSIDRGRIISREVMHFYEDSRLFFREGRSRIAWVCSSRDLSHDEAVTTVCR